MQFAGGAERITTLEREVETTINSSKADLEAELSTIRRDLASGLGTETTERQQEGGEHLGEASHKGTSAKPPTNNSWSQKMPLTFDGIPYNVPL